MSFEEFVNIININYDDCSFDCRYGQTVMNILNRVWPEKYKEISKTDYDCFYDDGIVKLTLEKLKTEWNIK